MREAATHGADSGVYGDGDGGHVSDVVDFGPCLVKKVSSVLVLCEGWGHLAALGGGEI